MPVSVRLDRETEGLVRRISKRSGRSKSQVIREAIRRLAREDTVNRGESVYDAISDLVGIADGGERNYGARSEEALRAMFHHSRRTR
jgi:predicted DNA-binding protein